jgi:cysteine desulfurase
MKEIDRQVYLDHAATTPTDSDVVKTMLPFLDSNFGNPGSFHSVGKESKDAIDDARSWIAKWIGARSDEIIFTGSGTESDNLAILGVARQNTDKGKHIVTTSIEHHAVLETMEYLARKEGFDLTVVSVERNGLVDPKKVIDVIRKDTTIVSVMMANNEIGTIQPVTDIGREIENMRKDNRAPHAIFHTDACQAASYIPLDVNSLHVDLLTLNGSKVYGPKGVGVLFAKRGLKLRPLMFGGAQEKARRPGTENTASIVGLQKALEIVEQKREEDIARLEPLQRKLAQGILSTVPKTRLNGDWQQRIPNNVNISFMDLEGEALLLYLDSKGIYVSTGSACTSASLDPSHVILALGLPYEVAHGSLRFSLGRSTTEADIDYVIETLPPLVEKLRSISPVKVADKYFKDDFPCQITRRNQL